ncbi:MAG: alpha/beta hydrolase [Firmicutes bacterium]|nr:alpha/beta hydrolase [Bacillota bacterium]
MKNLRIYGEKPYEVLVIHGGPGAPGSVAPLARVLSKKFGVIEPFQTEDSIKGQINELVTVIKRYCNKPITLIGHSWGAWLSYIFTSKYSMYVEKLILVSSGPYEEKYIDTMNRTRFNRFSEEEKTKVKELSETLYNPNTKNLTNVFKELGSIMTKVDSYEPIVYEDEIVKYQPKIFMKSMSEISKLRENGKLLDMGKNIECPVITIHGDYDAHPYCGVKEPLAKVIKNYNFILLDKCGHYPWNEYYAKEKFYEILFNEI